ncbi:MAG: hypothetical protein AB1422_02595 [bacterium]
MENNQKIKIGKRILTRKELFEEKGKFRKERAKLPFNEKIKALSQLQELAYSWGNKKDIIVWKI